MAKPEHLAKLKEGVKAWNLWRKNEPKVKPNLREADLRLMNLRGANLSGANLKQVNLNSVDLRKANLRRAAFKRADIRRAILRGADLRKADLTEADLRRADLRKTNLRDAVLRDACLKETILADIDLSLAKGLGQCRHRGPSIIDHRTLMRSGQLPKEFLRGCGLPDSLISDLPVLAAQANRFYSCFISHASKDKEFANKIHADLQDKGVRCWFAPEDMKIGAKIIDTIDHTIRHHDKLLLILSEASIASGWVEDEVTMAFAQERSRDEIVLFPIRIDDAAMSTDRAWATKLQDSRHVGDFTSWEDRDDYKRALDGLLRDLKVEEAPAAEE